MANVSTALTKGLLLSMLTVGLVSCEQLESLTSETSSTSSSTAAVGQDVTCETANYLGKITWEGETAQLTFARKPDETNLDQATPVSILSNADGSTTYGYQRDLTVYLRAYPDGSCLLQALDSQGTITVEEFGQTGFVEQVNAQANVQTDVQKNIQTSDQVDAQANAQPANPSIAPIPHSAGAGQSVASLSNPANAAELPESIAPASNQVHVAMTCAGSIKNSVDFTAYFDREAGFNRVVFRPRESKIAVVSNLSHNGKNDQGQHTWRGKANEVSDVTLVHLSATVPQPGDQVSVDYDGLLGQATCQ